MKSSTVVILITNFEATVKDSNFYKQVKVSTVTVVKNESLCFIFF